MRLIDKFTLWYVLISAIVLLTGSLILFNMVEAEIIGEESRRLKDKVEMIARNLYDGEEVEDIEGLQVLIEELNFDAAPLPLRIVDTLAWFQPHNHNERALKAEASYKIKGKHYFISTFNYIGESDDIASGITHSLLLIFILLLFLVVIVNRIISRRILTPFNQTLNVIKSFNLKQKDQVKLPSTNTVEFKELNHFLENMTAKSLEDYRVLKEFSENASHELQTPLAIIRGKLELLMETDISEEQAAFISSIHNQVKKLSSINQSLTLLTKLENLEYESNSLNLTELLRKTLASFEELIDMKSLRVEKEIEDNVNIALHPFLADILLNNLISNAIRHNEPSGFIKVILTSSELTVINPGTPPELPTSAMFQRFKKSNQSSSSIGLGLAIVKQICDLNNFNIHYKYQTMSELFSEMKSTITDSQKESNISQENASISDQKNDVIENKLHVIRLKFK